MFRKLIQLSKHSFIYSFGMLSTQLISFLLLPLYTRYLTPAEYGILEILRVTQSVLGIFFGMSFSSAIFMAYFKSKDLFHRKVVQSTTLIFLTVTSLTFSFTLSLMSPFFSVIFFRSYSYSLYFTTIFLILFFDTAILIVLAIYRAKNASKKYVAVSLLRMLLTIFLRIFFLVYLKMGIFGLLTADLISVFAIYFLLVPITIIKVGFHFSRGELVSMLRFGLPLMVGNLASWILTVSDRYFLLFFASAEQLGFYSLGYKIGLIIHILIVTPFTLAWSPFYWSVSKEKNSRKIYSRVLTYFTLVSLLIVLTISAFAKEVVFLLATPAYYPAHQVIPLIALSYVFYGMYAIFAVGYNLAKKTSYVPFIVGTGAIVNIILNFILIPPYGMMGAALATLISYIVLPIGAYLISQKYYPINYEWERMLKILLVATIFYVPIYILNEREIHTSPFFAIIVKVLLILLFPLGLYIIKFYQPQEIQKAKHLISQGMRRVFYWKNA